MPDLAALSSHEVDLDLELDLDLDLGPPALPRRFFSRPAEVVAPELIGCLLVRRQPSGALLWGVIVETEAYTQDDPACHGHRRRSASNETLFGPPGNFYVYRCYGIHHCVNVVTDRAEWASGVLLRAAALPAAPERQASGPGLLARCFGIEQCHDGQGACGEGPLWLAPCPSPLQALLSPAPTAAPPLINPGAGIWGPAAASVAGPGGTASRQRQQLGGLSIWTGEPGGMAWAPGRSTLKLRLFAGIVR